MTTCCTVVIGHVDHGKTALVHALTGAETDQLAEEKARGLSIVPGFAHHSYPGGMMDFIDAPGHADFVQAMIRAATGARAALIVISATEGIAAQTREHLSIATLLGITNAVIAVTKSDLLAPADAASRLNALRADLAATAFATSPMILCSAQTNDGIGPLHDALETLLHRPAPTGPKHSFLPIDRVFSVAGLGTIVTGTLQGSAATVDDAMLLLPAGRTTTLRGVQSHGTPHRRIEPGARIAANLRGVAVDEVSSGAVLCAPDNFAPSRCLDVALTLLDGTTAKHMQDLRVHIGTASQVATLRLFGGGKVGAKGTVLAQLRFGKPVAAFAGQPAILRQLSPTKTIGGAIVLDPQAQPTGAGDKTRHRVLTAALTGDLNQMAEAMCEVGHGAADGAQIARLSRLIETECKARLEQHFQTITTTYIAQRSRIALTEAAMLDRLKAYHHAHPLRSMAPLSALDVPATAAALITFVRTDLNKRQIIRLDDAGVALTSHDPLAALDDATRDRMTEIEGAYRHAGLQPLAPDALVQTPQDEDILYLLTDLGRLATLRNVGLGQTLVFHANTLADAAENLRQHFPAPQTFTTSQARTALGTSRRIIVPIVEHLDAQGITERRGDSRRFTR